MREASERMCFGWLLRSLCIGCVGFLLCCGMLFAEAVLIERGLLPEGVERFLVYGSVLTFAVLVGLFAAGASNRRVVRSIMAGAVFLLLSAICGACLGGVISGNGVLIIGGAMFGGCMLGALLSGLVWR